MLSRHTAVLCAVALSAPVAPALARGHIHCEIRPWGPIELTPTPNTPYPIDFFTGSNVTLTFSNIVLPLPTPLPSMPGCTYEISDITTIRVTLLISGSAISFSSLSAGTPPVSPLNPGPYSFGSSTPTMVFTFRTHDAQASGVLSASFPSPTLSLSMTGSANLRSYVEGATIQFSGNHYFVPGPASATLVLAGIACLARRRRAASPA